ncbi:MAG: hypothetical protein M1540_03725 [Candidatus Bathyarchaeota archaeon]|nr:hypothetical protein [Candidatus Bathyarchaeota archaeon]
MVQMPSEEQRQNRKKILVLKTVIFALYAIFVALSALGQILANSAVSFASLMAFTAAAAFTTYYMVLTQL